MSHALAEFSAVYLENACGDAKCERRRLDAALHVLRGGTRHDALAQVIETTLELRSYGLSGRALPSGK